ncbi:Fe-Mn family superoxide dismutase [Paenibacillus lemnae]|uniref:superoxide dismutase n=1 Tax=Paenibacillus lemnae TaxID=1330551 RepID=A0A848MBL8_PAELE|nr:Fe-Mn family superoxide dismutase [Paenibacillus lemnae]NMO98085.1 DUF2935 domain-containing protein [Paenibacillus lemnae]
MLYIYGHHLPARILEEIVFWKHQEAEHTEVIQAIVPRLEETYVKLLNDWAAVFTETEKAAELLLQQTMTSSEALSPSTLNQIELLVRISMDQSREFVRQLRMLEKNSPAVKKVPLAPTVLEHIIRESEYFLDVLKELSEPGALQQLMNHSGSGTPLPFTGAVHPFQQLEQEAVVQGVSAPPELNPVPIGGHRLPPLPYAYNALEPYIDEKTMKIHHDKHHQSYVDGLNKAETKLEEARKTGKFDLIKHWERELAFHGAGHYLHTLFWSIMSPNGGGKPQGSLAEQINKDFGSFERFKSQFSEAADKVEGNGWAILVWSPRSQRLEILQAEKHQNLSQWDVVPLLAIDVWEHSYYLKHQNNRKAYVQDWWNVINWPEVQTRYDAAMKLRWQPY